MTHHYLKNIITSPVYDVAIQTPLSLMERLSSRLGHKIYAKREDLQPVFSFKIRGAYNKMSRLSALERERGVICSSAGNHAQGVACSAHKLGIKAVIVMPVTTPAIKIEAVKRLGGEWVEVVLHGDVYDEASKYAKALCVERDYVYIHPFDDPDVIAGQGTIGLELITQHPHPIDAVFVPIGGGGLAAGVAVLLKQLRPEIKIVGVEPVDSASMTQAVAQNERIELKTVGIFADGVAVKQPGEITFDLIRQYVDEFVTVTTDEICAAIKDLFEDTRAISEPSGAVALAGLKKWSSQQSALSKPLTLMHIVSGANMNFERLRYITERTALGEQSEGLLAVEIPERAGAFLAFCETLNYEMITEFNYRYQDHERAEILVGVQLQQGQKTLDGIMQKLDAHHYTYLNLSHNELAKSHVRYMVGGLVPSALEHERLFRFGFPERRGALIHFLRTLGSQYNITLFHYRHDGGDSSSVLVGIQSALNDTDLMAYLRGIGYEFYEETYNPVYQRFLNRLPSP
ncbi:MAG: threonine ammonia-lyase, biosynthetic [Cardiobacteriaceae bacterium]|nr:threonine ammonia-lyase, biosynthetic [Cardiobacteriaceae bacterium]